MMRGCYGQGVRVTLLAGVCALSPLCSVALPQDADETARRHFDAAHQAQDAGDLDTAAREYLAVIRLLPDAAEAYASLGLVYHAQGQYAESARALSRADKLKPGLPGVNLYLGIDYERQRQAALAVPQLLRAVRLDSQSKDAQVWLGRALWDEGHTQQALAQFHKTATLFPADPALLLEAGEAYHKAAELRIERVLAESGGTALLHQVYGDIYNDERAWDNASAHYYRALELDPHWARAHYGLGEVALRKGKLAQAAQEFKQELTAHPASAAALARLAEIAMLQDKVEEALPLLNQAIHVSGYEAAHAMGLPRAFPATSEDLSEPDQRRLQAGLQKLQLQSSSAGRTLAMDFVQMRVGDRDGFAVSWKAFSEALPHVASGNAYQQGLANFYRQDFEAAAANLDGWGKTHPKDLASAYLLATAYRNLSLNTLEQLFTLAPDSYPAHELLAETYENAEQDEKALAEYRVVAGMAPDLPGVHYSIGHLLAKTGKGEEARAEMAAELHLNPEHAEANAEMGSLLLDQQETAEAIPFLERALRADPDLWATYNALGKAYYAQKDYSRAEAALEKAIRHDPQGLAHFQLGLVYRSLGQKEAANTQFAISRTLKLQALTQDETKMTRLKELPQ